jgi:trans-2,3-dihydro-3-hydroxyanthranilate isomerase
MAGHRFTWLDVFSGERFQGNGLAVIHDADDIADATMHRIARETRLSETSFIQSSAADGADYRHRIWMMTGEIPFAGHPSLGSAAAVARARGETRATYVQETRPGLQVVDVEGDGDRARVSMLQEPPQFGDELDPGDVLPLVGLEEDDADPGLPVQVVSTGAPMVVAPVRDAARLQRLWPDYDRIGALLAGQQAIVLYVVAVDPAAGTARARSFAGSPEIGEDPATGAAAGTLMAHAAARAGVERLDIVQGVEMGRPSLLRTAVEGDRVRVGGDVVVVVEGVIHVDA